MCLGDQHLELCECYGLGAAHARLMFRSEVTQSDAIAAVVCMESSMTTSAILDGMDNVLLSGFPENPDEECILFNSIVNSKYVQSFGFHCSH